MAGEKIVEQCLSVIIIGKAFYMLSDWKIEMRIRKSGQMWRNRNTSENGDKLLHESVRIEIAANDIGGSLGIRIELFIKSCDGIQIQIFDLFGRKLLGRAGETGSGQLVYAGR